MPEERLRYLLERYFAKTCTEKEQRELSHLILEAKDDNSLTELLEKIWSDFIPSGTMPQEKSDLIIDSILKENNSPKISFAAKTRRMIWWRVAAAIIVLVLSGGSFLIYFNHNSGKHKIVKASVHDVSAPNEIKAKLTLGDGRTIYLDSTLNGSVAIQGNVKVIKNSNGQISYNGTNDKIIYNTLSNPRGSRVISLMLSDGSKVWLNAGSTLKYPITFIGAERKVEITGEAYFEVAKNPSMPFYVTYGSISIKVLGTHFNVNAFEDDDSNIKVTLLEGAVKINNGSSKAFLKPGQQALVSNEVKVVDDVDVDKVMAWKNGYFQFDKASLQSVLKQVSGWYNVEVIYQGKNQPRQFIGEIERDLSLSEVLKILKINNVDFIIQEKKLIIKPD